MPERNQHIIHSLQYDIQFQQSKANAQEETISRWHNEHFSPVLEDVFEQLAPGNAYIVAGRLELDLGKIPKSGGPEVISSRLREILSEKLADLAARDLPLDKDIKKPAANGDSAEEAAYGKQSPEEHRISLLLRFLRSGHFSWQAGSGTSAVQLYDQIGAKNEKLLFDALESEFRTSPISLIRFLQQMKAEQRKSFYASRLPGLRKVLDETGLIMASLSLRSGAAPALAYTFMVRVKAMIIRNALAGKTLLSLKELIREEKDQLIKMIPEGMISLPPGARPFETAATDPPILNMIMDLIREKLLPGESMKKRSSPPSKQALSAKDEKPEKRHLKRDKQDDTLSLPEEEILILKEDECTARPDEELEKGLMAMHGGLVLLHPYLAKLFTALDLLEGDAFKGMLAQYEAVFVLHFLAGGDQPVEEHALLIPKILCGLQTDRPLPSEFPLKKQTLTECRNLLQAVIKNWDALGSTSVKGLQDSFLRRECLIRKTDENYEFFFERKGMDVLIDRIPWGISMLKLKWTPYLINVSW